MLADTAAAFPDKPALCQPLSGGKSRRWTWREYCDEVRFISVGLSTLGVGKGSIVALQSETRAEFYLADLGVMSAGAITAALYTSLSFADQAQAITTTGARVAFVENTKALLGLEGALGQAAREIRWIVLTGESAGTLTLVDLIQAGKNKLAVDAAAFDDLQKNYDASAIAILYMTSGATGEPKMGLVSHRALVVNLEMTPEVVPLSPADRTLVFLPSAHMAQRMVGELLPVYSGCAVWFSEGLSKLPHELRSVKPTLFLSPPRLWERMYSSIVAEIRKRPVPIQKLFHFGLGLGSKAAGLKRAGKPTPSWMRSVLRFLDGLMFSKIRERLGGQMRVPISGSAPLGKDLAIFFEAIGMPLVEGYGLTEGGVVSVNPIDAPRPGSIGKILPGVQVRIEEDGELMIGGPTVFDGYFKDSAATAAVLRDGWLATGDIAESDAEGFYYITGRKKELIVSSNGKKIYPARIEALFKREPLISQVLLIGDKLPYVTALITVNGNPAEAAGAVSRAVKDVNRQLPSFEQVRKFKILDRDFTIEQGELTPTMKLRKSRAIENHRVLVNELYAGREFE